MNAQQTFTDIEYGSRRRMSKRDRFLKKIDKTVPWDDWAALVKPLFPEKKRGRPCRPPETMLRMWLLRTLYGLNDAGTEDAASDSYAMRTFLRIDFASSQIPDATTLGKFRLALKRHGLEKKLLASFADASEKARITVRKGKIREASYSRWAKK